MKVIALEPGTTHLRLADKDQPKIQKDDEILAKVVSVGICGTDREETEGGRADAPSGEKELIIGHEMLSKVVEVGKKVTSVKPGDHVVFTVRRGCDNCPACLNARSDMCLTGNYTERGIKGRHGFHAEYVVDQECYAVKVPESIIHIAVLTEPMSVVQKAIEESILLQMTRLPYLKNNPNWLQGKKVLVAGMGTIGLLASIVLRLKGADVFGLDIIDKSSPRAQILEALGGTYLNDKEINLTDFQKNHPHIDLILDAAGVAKLDFDLLGALGINGIFVLTGVPGTQHAINLDGALLMKNMVLKNQIMLGSVNESVEHFRNGLKDLEAACKKWPGVVEKLISKHFPYTDFQKAFAEHLPDEVKIVIDWS